MNDTCKWCGRKSERVGLGLTCFHCGHNPTEMGKKALTFTTIVVLFITLLFVIFTSKCEASERAVAYLCAEQNTGDNKVRMMVFSDPDVLVCETHDIDEGDPLASCQFHQILMWPPTNSDTLMKLVTKFAGKNHTFTVQLWGAETRIQWNHILHSCSVAQVWQ